MKKLILIPLLALVGCSTPRDIVPQTEITGSLGGKPVKVALPKDMKAKEIKFSSDTNGCVEVSIKEIETRMNPDVITVSTKGYADMRDADSRFVKETITTAVSELSKAK